MNEGKWPAKQPPNSAVKNEKWNSKSQNSPRTPSRFVEMFKFQENEVRIDYTGKVSDNEIRFTRKVGDFAAEEFVAKWLLLTHTRYRRLF